MPTWGNVGTFLVVISKQGIHYLSADHSRPFASTLMQKVRGNLHFLSESKYIFTFISIKKLNDSKNSKKCHKKGWNKVWQLVTVFLKGALFLSTIVDIICIHFNKTKNTPFIWENKMEFRSKF